jgi:hypothetical protein
MARILETAARIGYGQLRVQSLADRRPDRVVWPGRQWQWASLRFEDGYFRTDGHLDVDAREKWFFQAIGASPAMFRRAEGAGSHSSRQEGEVRPSPKRTSDSRQERAFALEVQRAGKDAAAGHR